nr:hypothetical protein [Tanacetum cinerariifolium]
MTPDELKEHVEGMVTYEAKRAKMLEEYNHCISFRADPLPITNIGYRISNSTNEACMRITRNHQPLNLTMYENFMLKMLGFSEWLELHDLTSKVKNKSNDQILKNPTTKFQWVVTQVRNLDIVVDGMHRNLVPLSGVVASDGLVISESESWIFFYNGNFDLVFQREE